MSGKPRVSKFNVDDPVWAKMKGFPPWPGRVSEPTKELLKLSRKGCYCIYFFGSNNYGWIEPSLMWNYFEAKGEMLSKAPRKPPAVYAQACEEIEEYIKKGSGSASIKTSEDAFDKLLSPPSTPKPTKTSKKDSLSSSSGEKSSGHSEKASRKSVGAKTASPKKSKRSSVQGSPSINGETPIKRSKKSSSDATPVNSVTRVKSRSPSISGSPERSVRESSPETNGEPNESVAGSATLNITQGEANESQGSLVVGIIGLGVIGSRVAKHLIEAGYKVIVWNRSKEKSQKFAEVGIEVARSPADLADRCNVILSCLSDGKASQELILDTDNGLVSSILNNKIYVEMSTMDVDMSRDLEDIILRCGGQYLESQIQGSREDADNRELVLVCAGSRQAFDTCLQIFEAFTTQSFFVGETGKAIQSNLLVQMFRAVYVGGIAEGLALADRANHKLQDVKEILSMTDIYSPFCEKITESIIEGSFTPNYPLKRLQRDMQLGLLLGDSIEHPLPVTAAANEVYKHAKRLGYRDADVSAVYVRARF